jgi:hypothetical protein
MGVPPALTDRISATLSWRPYRYDITQGSMTESGHDQLPWVRRRHTGDVTATARHSQSPRLGSLRWLREHVSSRPSIMLRSNPWPPIRHQFPRGSQRRFAIG